MGANCSKDAADLASSRQPGKSAAIAHDLQPISAAIAEQLATTQG
jgi:hypothetical protein